MNSISASESNSRFTSQCRKVPKAISPSELLKIQNHSWLVKNFDINTLKFIGNGGFGAVFSAKDKKNNEELAIKFLLKQNDENIYESFFNELSSLRKCKENPNIVTLKYIYNDDCDKEIIIAMEKADKSLESLLKSNNSLCFSQILQIASDITNGLILSKNQLSLHHLDIKPGNILIYILKGNIIRKNIPGLQDFNVFEDNVVYKLGDFGSAIAEYKGTIQAENFCLSYSKGYSCPELINPDISELNLEKCDVFSLGMTIIECCGILKEEFMGISDIKKKKIYDMELEEIILETLKKNINLPEDFIEFIIKMVQFNRGDRITLEEIWEKLQIYGQKNKNINEENTVLIKKKSSKNNEKIEKIIEKNEKIIEKTENIIEKTENIIPIEKTKSLNLKKDNEKSEIEIKKNNSEKIQHIEKNTLIKSSFSSIFSESEKNSIVRFQSEIIQEKIEENPIEKIIENKTECPLNVNKEEELAKKEVNQDLTKCLKGHFLQWNTKEYDFGTYKCDKCSVRGQLCKDGRWNCMQCKYDLCHKCKLPLEKEPIKTIEKIIENKTVCPLNVNKEEELAKKEVNQDLTKCLKGHFLQWNTSEKEYDITYKCDKCSVRDQKCKDGRWNCMQCKYDLCHKCKLPLEKEPIKNSSILSLNCSSIQKKDNNIKDNLTNCPKGHILHWNTSTNKYPDGIYYCDNCDKKLKNEKKCEKGRWNCLECIYDLCNECRPRNSFNFDYINECNNGHPLKWNVKNYKDFDIYPCYKCEKEILLKNGRWVCFICQYDICNDCRPMEMKEIIVKPRFLTFKN